MIITCGPAKRAKTLKARGLDFMDAAQVLAGLNVEVEDAAFSMRKANAREQEKIAPLLEV